MLNMWSAAGQYLAWVISDTKYADLAPGLSYGITLVNSTASDVTSGTITLQGADAKPDDPCAPDVWAALQTVPGCEGVVEGTVTGPATITFTPQHPLKAHSQCTYSAPCPQQFLRATGIPSSVDAIVVVTRLKRNEFSVGTNTGQIVSATA